MSGLQVSSGTSTFEAAIDAVVNGDIATLKRLLSDQPDLIHGRSVREHGATLLHYVSANGVEDYRQKTPKNIVEIAELLLQAGAEIDATANMYGASCTTLGLAATSIHPERAGVQEALLQTLLDHGANIDQPSSAGHGRSIVITCVANGRAKAAEFLASRGAPLDFAGAAAVGRLDLVQTFFEGRIESSVTPEQLNDGFLFACSCGRNGVIEFLIEKGADLKSQSSDGQTGLHCAVIGGYLETVKLLLQHNPPLEARNIYGATVLGQALWSEARREDPRRYTPIIQTLIAAGAQIP